MGTDGRFSGATRGLRGGQVAPEASAGGPIALLREGDTVTLDIDAGTIMADVSEEEFARRRSEWTAPAPHYTVGVLAKYAASVTSASEGAITVAKF